MIANLLRMEAWVTLATNDDYAVGALTLAASLKRVQTSKKLAIMITKMISENVKKTLNEVFDDVISVEEMDSGDLANLTLLDRTELGITFTKVCIIIKSIIIMNLHAFRCGVGPSLNTLNACSWMPTLW